MIWRDTSHLYFLGECFNSYSYCDSSHRGIDSSVWIELNSLNVNLGGECNEYEFLQQCVYHGIPSQQWFVVFLNCEIYSIRVDGFIRVF